MIKFFVTFLSKACNIQFSPLFSLLSNGLLMSIGFLLILDTSGWLECFHHQEDNSCSDECVKFNSNASKPTFTQVPRRQKLNCLTLLFLIGFGFQFLPFFSSLPVFPTKIGQEIIDSKVMGKLQKITQQRDYFKRFWPFSSQRSFKFPSLNFIMSCGLKKEKIKIGVITAISRVMMPLRKCLSQ